MWFISYFSGLGISFQCTSTETEQLVRHAKAEHAGRQHNHAQPAPGTDGAHRGQDNQNQSSDDAKNAVYTAYVFNHGISFNCEELKQTLINAALSECVKSEAAIDLDCMVVIAIKVKVIIWTNIIEMLDVDQLDS